MEEKGRTASGAGLEHQLEELQRRATQDALSGLLNRETLELVVKDRLRSLGPEDTCALFIVDLDDFKRVNDTLGHQAGDQAIRQAGQILSNLFYARDIVGRLGGDEFAVFLYGSISLDLVRAKASQICGELQLVLGTEQTLTLTASVGVYLAGKGQEFEGLYHSADLALYKAKKNGKHQFYLKNGDVNLEDPGAPFRPVNAIPLGELLENMGSGVALLELGEDPQVIYVSPTFCGLIGEDPKAVKLPLPLSHFIHPQDYPGVLEALRESAGTGRALEHSHRVRVAEGARWAWWRVYAVQIDYDAPHPVLLITASDVSQFKERELRQEERIQGLLAALNQTSKQVWDVDLETGIFHAYTPEGKYKVLGPGEMKLPWDLMEQGWVHPNSVARFQLFAQELLEGSAQGFGNFAIRSADTGSYTRP